MERNLIVTMKLDGVDAESVKMVVLDVNNVFKSEAVTTGNSFNSIQLLLKVPKNVYEFGTAVTITFSHDNDFEGRPLVFQGSFDINFDYWTYNFTSAELNGAVKTRTSELKFILVFSFTENNPANTATKKVGLFNDISKFPPTIIYDENYYVSLNGLIYQSISGIWTDTGLLEIKKTSGSIIITQSLKGGFLASVEPIDASTTDLLIAQVSKNTGDILTINELLGINGDNFIKSDFDNNYAPVTIIRDEDILVMNDALDNFAVKRITIAQLRELFGSNFLGYSDYIDLLPDPFTDPDLNKDIPFTAIVIFEGTSTGGSLVKLLTIHQWITETGDPEGSQYTWFDTGEKGFVTQEEFEVLEALVATKSDKSDTGLYDEFSAPIKALVAAAPVQTESIENAVDVIFDNSAIIDAGNMKKNSYATSSNTIVDKAFSDEDDNNIKATYETKTNASAQIALKQNIAEPLLGTTDKTIPGSINEVLSTQGGQAVLIGNNASTISANTGNIDGNASDITDLQNSKISGVIVEKDGVLLDGNVNKINYTTNMSILNPTPGEIEVSSSGGGSGGGSAGQIDTTDIGATPTTPTGITCTIVTQISLPSNLQMTTTGAELEANEDVQVGISSQFTKSGGGNAQVTLDFLADGVSVATKSESIPTGGSDGINAVFNINKQDFIDAGITFPTIITITQESDVSNTTTDNIEIYMRVTLDTSDFLTKVVYDTNNNGKVDKADVNVNGTYIADTQDTDVALLALDTQVKSNFDKDASQDITIANLGNDKQNKVPGDLDAGLPTSVSAAINHNFTNKLAQDGSQDMTGGLTFSPAQFIKGAMSIAQATGDPLTGNFPQLYFTGVGATSSSFLLAGANGGVTIGVGPVADGGTMSVFGSRLDFKGNPLESIADAVNSKDAVNLSVLNAKIDEEVIWWESDDLGASVAYSIVSAGFPGFANVGQTYWFRFGDSTSSPTTTGITLNGILLKDKFNANAQIRDVNNSFVKLEFDGANLKVVNSTIGSNNPSGNTDETIRKSGGKAGGTINFQDKYKAINLVNPTNAQDAVTKQHFDDGLTNKLNVNGTNQMTGDLDFGNNKGINLATPIDPDDAVPKSYADGLSGKWVQVGGSSVATALLGGGIIITMPLTETLVSGQRIAIEMSSTSTTTWIKHVQILNITDTSVGVILSFERSNSRSSFKLNISKYSSQVFLTNANNNLAFRYATHYNFRASTNTFTTDTTNSMFIYRIFKIT